MCGPGRTTAFVIATEERHPLLPEVPTSGGSSLPHSVSAWNGLFAPKATPKPILDKLADALDKALDDDNTRKSPARIRHRPFPQGGSSRTTAACCPLVQSEPPSDAIIKAANVKAE